MISLWHQLAIQPTKHFHINYTKIKIQSNHLNDRTSHLRFHSRGGAEVSESTVPNHRTFEETNRSVSVIGI